MKKQLTAWLLALVMLFSLVGCGADAPVQDDSSLPQQEQQDAQNAPSEDADTLSDDDASARRSTRTAPTRPRTTSRSISTPTDIYRTTSSPRKMPRPSAGRAGRSSPTRRANASAAAGSATTKVSCPRRTDAPTPNATSTRWARIRAGPNASSSQTTASFTTPKTTTSPLNCCTGRSERPCALY